MRPVTAGLLLLGMVAAGAAPACSAPPPASATEHAGEVRVTRAYVNRDYGFRLTVPPGIAAWRAAAPAPNHGVRLALGPGRGIEVFASFDAADYGSTAALLDATLGHVGGRAAGPAATRSPVRLAGRPAEQARYGPATRRTVVIAQQTGPADDRINLLLTLTTDAQHAGADERTLQAVVASFRTLPRG